MKLAGFVCIIDMKAFTKILYLKHMSLNVICLKKKVWTNMLENISMSFETFSKLSMQNVIFIVQYLRLRGGVFVFCKTRYMCYQY